MPWKANGPGCPCCSVNVCITVNGCPQSGSPFYHRFAGTTVNAINGGVTVASGTTNSSGVCCLDVPPGSGYTFEAVPDGATHYDTGTLTGQTATAGGTYTVTIPPASGYTCCKAVCCPQDDYTTLPYVETTFPTTLYLTDDQGTVELTRQDTDESCDQHNWVGCATRSGDDGFVGGAPDDCSPSSGSAEFRFTVECFLDVFGDAVWLLTIEAEAPCCGGPPCALNVNYVLDGGSCGDGANSIQLSAYPDSCDPITVSWSYSGPGASTSGVEYAYPSATTFELSE